MTITRKCDKCGKEEDYKKGLSSLCNSCSAKHDKLCRKLYTELEAKLDAWLKSK